VNTSNEGSAIDAVIGLLSKATRLLGRLGLKIDVGPLGPQSVAVHLPPVSRRTRPQHQMQTHALQKVFTQQKNIRDRSLRLKQEKCFVFRFRVAHRSGP
jgi:hypothetical protein